jgi:U3 small nucleolar RNA-associated protein 3
MEDKDNNWGNKRKDYYQRNRTGKEEDNYIEEEEEAKKLQQAKLKKMREMNLLDSDEEVENNAKGNININKEGRYLLDSSSEEEIEENKLKNKKTQLTKLSNEEKEEYTQLLKNIKVHVNEIEENTNPVLEIIQSENLALKNTCEYLKVKKNAHLLYTVYLLYYLYYKNTKKISDHHPVLKKMLMIKNYIQQLQTQNEDVFAEIDKILKLIEANKIRLEDDMDNDNDNEDMSEEQDLPDENKLLNKKRTAANEDLDNFINKNKNKIQKLKGEREKKINKEKEKIKKEVEEKDFLGTRLANKNIIKSRGIYRKRKNYQGNAKLNLREKYYKKEKIRKNLVKEYEGKQ